MSGNFQLMQYTPCIEDFFEPDHEIICWKNKKDLFEKIIYYLENENERKKIARRGYNRAIKNHTWSHRFEKLLLELKRKKEIDISKYIIKTDELLKNKKILKVRKSYIRDSTIRNITLIKSILRIKKYKIKQDLKYKSRLKISQRDFSFYYKPNLNNFLFIEIYGRVMMVLKALSPNSKINLNEWNNFKKILYLTENEDLSLPKFDLLTNRLEWIVRDSNLPQFGILTNGSNWIIRDIKNKKWLKDIPNRDMLKILLNVKRYLMLKIIFHIKKYSQILNLNEINPLGIKNKIPESFKFSLVNIKNSILNYIIKYLIKFVQL